MVTVWSRSRSQSRSAPPRGSRSEPGFCFSRVADVNMRWSRGEAKGESRDTLWRAGCDASGGTRVGADNEAGDGEASEKLKSGGEARSMGNADKAVAGCVKGKEVELEMKQGRHSGAAGIE
eukprot:gene19806-biopygen20554